MTDDEFPVAFGAAWRSKCEDLARETAKVTALIGVIRGVIEAARPGTPPEVLEQAWRAAAAVIAVDEARQDEDFIARLERVRAELSASSPPHGVET